MWDHVTKIILLTNECHFYWSQEKLLKYVWFEKYWNKEKLFHQSFSWKCLQKGGGYECNRFIPRITLYSFTLSDQILFHRKISFVCRRSFSYLTMNPCRVKLLFSNSKSMVSIAMNVFLKSVSPTLTVFYGSSIPVKGNSSWLAVGA